jgi:hypothetical protein
MNRPVLLAILLGASALQAGAVAGNLPPAGQALATGLLMGTVIDPLDDRPVADAQVTLGGATPAIRTTVVLTDEDGRFVFMDLPKGVYTLTATKPGYAEGAYGRRRPGGLLQSIVLADAERLSDLRIPIWKFGVITGRVTDEAGEPMVGISVRVLQRTVVAGRRTLTPGAAIRTDDRGIYRIASLTPGDYLVVVATTQSTAPVSILDLYRQRLTSAAARETDLMRGVSFSGLTTSLNLFERHSDARVGTLAFLSTGGGVRAPVAPASAGGGRLHVYPTRFYPAASTTGEAAVVTVRSGEERAGIDLQLTLVATSRVSGIASGPNGPQVAALALVPDTEDLSTDAGFETATTVSDADGRFTFIGVPPGRHQLRAVWLSVPAVGGGSRGGAPPPPKPAAPLPALGGFTLWSVQTLAVGSSDISDLAIALRPGFRLSGRAEFVGAAAQPAPDVVRRISATFDPADGRPFVASTVGRGQFDESGRLSTYQLPPGRYYLRINNAPPGWMLKSASVSGRDISNVPVTLDRDITGLVVTFTDRPSSLSGQVSDGSGPDPSATVLVFPVESSAWIGTGEFPRRLRSIRVTRDARYQTSGLPSGEYFVVAIPEEAAANWQDPVNLQALARSATRVTLAEGESRALALTSQAVRR